jgi:hypothetical protein
MLGLMSELWYPGRPPFCSESVISLLGQFVEELLNLVAHEDGSRLDVLEDICEAALDVVGTENEDCLGTDENLQGLYALFADSMRGAIVFYKAGAWKNIYDLATNMTVVRNQLIETLEGVTDAQRGLSSETPGGTGAGADCATCPGEADPSTASDRDQQESPGPLQASFEEAKA